jgi:Electron transfer DM13
LPTTTTTDVVNQKEALQEYQKFISMNEQDRMNTAKLMSQKEKNMVMMGATQINNTINENNITTRSNDQQTHNNSNNATSFSKIRTGSFVGAGHGFHNAEGIAKVIPLGDGSTTILRLENFKSTNGPDVHVYLSTNKKTASDFVNLGRLKANNGNQNYNIPTGTDLAKYKAVLIWCQPFSVLFGSAEFTT